MVKTMGKSGRFSQSNWSFSHSIVISAHLPWVSKGEVHGDGTRELQDACRCGGAKQQKCRNCGGFLGRISTQSRVLKLIHVSIDTLESGAILLMAFVSSQKLEDQLGPLDQENRYRWPTDLMCCYCMITSQFENIIQRWLCESSQGSQLQDLKRQLLFLEDDKVGAEGEVNQQGFVGSCQMRKISARMFKDLNSFGMDLEWIWKGLTRGSLEKNNLAAG